MTLFILAALIALALAMSNYNRITYLTRKIEELTRKYEKLQQIVAELQGADKDFTEESTSDDFVFLTDEDLQLEASSEATEEELAAPTPSIEPQRIDELHQTPALQTKRSHLKEAPKRHGINWMVWLGGTCVSLAGIFLVKYTIDQGYFGPTARIIAGFILGIALHAAAEYMRRKNRGTHGSIAALAGGGSITLFATLLASHHLYNLLPPMVVFGGLTVVALGTMALSLFHGPVLAAIGLVGAYAVPVLVETGSRNVNGLMIYSLIITVAAYLLFAQVPRFWIWVGTLVGSATWFMVTLSMTKEPLWHGLYLGIAAFLLISIVEDDKNTRGVVIDPARRLALMGFVLLQGLGYVSMHGWSLKAIQWLPLVWVVFNTYRKRGEDFNAWLLLFIHILASCYLALFFKSAPGYEWIAVPSAAIFFAMCLWVQRSSGPSHPIAALTWLAPLLWVVAAYTFIVETHGSLTLATWVLVLGLLYAALLGRQISQGKLDENATWLAISVHAAYSLAVVIYLQEATLTLALAVQAPSLVWLALRHKIPHMDIMIKVLLAVVGTRLTFAPFFFKYPIDTHWSLWTYGGSFLAVALATRMTDRSSELRPWLEGAAIHALILFVGAETRYYLYDGDVFAHKYTMKEAAINCSLWGAGAISYFRRSLVARWAEKVYEFYAGILMTFSILNYLALVTYWNPLFSQEIFRPFFNLMLLAYGAPIILWGAAAIYFTPDTRKLFLSTAAVSTWIFVSLEIRHLWHLNQHMWPSLETSNGELYSYSLAWLVMAVGAYLYGVAKSNRAVYLGGMILLGLVIAKIFLIDMAGLEGLYRVFSFMGLGLSLLGLAFLHQKLDPPKREKSR